MLDFSIIIIYARARLQSEREGAESMAMVIHEKLDVRANFVGVLVHDPPRI